MRGVDAAPQMLTLEGMTDAAPPPDPAPAADPAPAPASSASASPESPRGVLCRDKARVLVHKYAAGGAAWAMLPIPIPTSPALTALEAHMIYWIARMYGEAPSHTDTIMLAAGLEVGSSGLKHAARYLVGFIPVIGWGIKGLIAGAAIETMGQLIIKHFEAKYPGKVAA